MDSLTKAKINLFAVLRNIEDLCDMDEQARNAVPDKSISVQFVVPKVGKGTLIFENKKCRFVRGDCKASLKLWFTNHQAFNDLVDGKNVIPLFVNVFQIGFMLNGFKTLAARLEYYLKPTDEKLKDAEYFKINTFLTAYTAFNALCEIGNSDEIGKLNASRIPEGEIQAMIDDGPSMTLKVTKDHNMSVAKGKSDNMRALMHFKSLKAANDILNGKSDIFSGLGEGVFEIRGCLPMLDNMSKLLTQVSKYLQ